MRATPFFISVIILACWKQFRVSHSLNRGLLISFVLSQQICVQSSSPHSCECLLFFQMFKLFLILLPGTIISYQFSLILVMRMLRNRESKALCQMIPCQPLSCQLSLSLPLDSRGSSLYWCCRTSMQPLPRFFHVPSTMQRH